jgi:hypothetical protein
VSDEIMRNVKELIERNKSGEGYYKHPSPAK